LRPHARRAPPAQATITSPEHLAAYAEYCKRALSNAVNGPLLSKRDAVLHQARLPWACAWHGGRSSHARSRAPTCTEARHTRPRRVRAAAQLARVNARSDEVRGISAEVERGVRALADDVADALRACEARRLLQLQAQAEELRRALGALQRCAEEAAAACAAPHPPLAFLERFRALSDACERLTAKPMREDIEVRPAA
jgi:hypothetical protein